MTIYDTCAANLVVLLTHKYAQTSICDACAADLVPKAAFATPVQLILGGAQYAEKWWSKVVWGH